MIPMEGGTQGSLQTRPGIKGSMRKPRKGARGHHPQPALLHHGLRGHGRLDVEPGALRMERRHQGAARRSQQGAFRQDRRIQERSAVAAARAAQGVQGFPGQLAHRRILRLRALRGDQEADQEQGYPGAVQLHEPRRSPPCRLHQRDPEGSRHRRRSGLPDQGEEVHLLPAEIHLLRDLSVREDRLCPLHHHLPADGAASRSGSSIRSSAGSNCGATTSSATARRLRC